MVLSDYGMTHSDDLVPIYLDEYLDLSYIQYVIVASGYATILPYALEQEKVTKKKYNTIVLFLHGISFLSLSACFILSLAR